MELGMIGLGRMGANMVQRLLRGGHRVVAYDPREEAVHGAVTGGAVGASSIIELAAKLATPRAVWIMVPSGEPTESTVDAVADALSAGDVIIDGGNSNYRDGMRRAEAFVDRGISFLDVGTSGGVWGLTEGYSMMIGGDSEPFAGSSRFSRRWRPPRTQGMATSVPRVPAISRKWYTTALSMG